MNLSFIDLWRITHCQPRVHLFTFQNSPPNFHIINLGEDFGLSLDTSKALDARRQGATTEAYEQYAARLPKSCTADRQGGAIEGNAADDALLVDQAF